MMKSCVVLNGKVINIGEWDYQYEQIENEMVARNPMPEGAGIVELEILEGADGGLYAADQVRPKTSEQRIAELEQLVADLASLQLGV
ncbi:hypothetical protein [Paenibacillus sp. LjRoot56]|uniref:hypothetical protein n=1 Tax=Paenibacillus sp. LjRoot56 TaxID=3342333 RepID=UPI003ECDD362